MNYRIDFKNNIFPCVLVCGDNCVFESWIGDIVLDMGKSVSNLNLKMSRLLMCYCHSFVVFHCDFMYPLTLVPSTGYKLWEVRDGGERTRDSCWEILSKTSLFTTRLLRVFNV